MKRLLLTVGTACAIVPMFGTTVDDLCWRDGSSPAITMATGDYRYYSLPTVQRGNVRLEKIDDTTIRIYNFLGIIEYADFTIDGDRIQLKGLTQTVRLKSNNQEVTICKGEIENMGRADGHTWYANWGLPGQQYYGQIVPKGGHEYSLEFTMPLFVHTGNAYTDEIYQSVQVRTYAPNATVTDKVKSYDGSQLDRSYEVDFAINENNELTFKNFANAGLAIEAGLNGNQFYYNPKFVTGEVGEIVNNTRTFTVTTSPLLVSLDANCYTDWYDIEDDYGNYESTELLYSPGTLNVVNLYFGKHTYESDGDWLRDVSGTIYGEVAHNDANHGWTAPDGGARTTSENIVGEMEPYVIWNEKANTALGLPKGEIQVVTDTKMNFGSTDVTLEADIDLLASSHSAADGLTLQGNVMTVNNGKYLDNYELMLVKGTHTSIAGNDAFGHAEKGHEDAINLSEYENGVAAYAADADRAFSIKVPADVLAQIDPESDGEYTLYAKANYKPESGLTSTFHALTPVKVEISTGVVTVGADAEEVHYYNLQGVEIFNPEKGQVVIKRQGNRTSKIVVR